MAPGLAALTTAVDAVVGVPVADLGPAECQDRIAAVARQRDRLDGWLSAAAGQLQVTTGGTVVTPEGRSRSVAGWLGEATRTSSQAAGARLATSTALRELPLVVAAVLDGVLSQQQAAVLARLVGRIEADSLAESQTNLIAVAAPLDPVQLGAWVADLIATHCEPALDDADAAAYDRRHLTTRQHADGSVRGHFRLAAGDAEPFLTAVEALARRQGDPDRRTAGQRRADALTELAERSLRHDTDLGEHGGFRPQISYVLPADWAARQADRQNCPTCSSCPEHRPQGFADTVLASRAGMPGVPAEHGCATAAWTGPATRARVEALLCDARISRVLLCERGQVTGLEPLRDTVTKAQRRALAARDLGCAARGCTRPPAMCDAHHLIERQHGGESSLENLVLLCRRHHVLWHLGKTTLADLHVPWHPQQSGADPPGPGPTLTVGQEAWPRRARALASDTGAADAAGTTNAVTGGVQSGFVDSLRRLLDLEVDRGPWRSRAACSRGPAARRPPPSRASGGQPGCPSSCREGRGQPGRQLSGMTRTSRKRTSPDGSCDSSATTARPVPVVFEAGSGRARPAPGPARHRCRPGRGASRRRRTG